MTRTAFTALSTFLVDSTLAGSPEHMVVESITLEGEIPIPAADPADGGSVLISAPVVDRDALVSALTTVVDTVDAEEGRYAAGLHGDHVNGFSYVLENGVEREYTDADLEADIAAHNARVALIRSLIASLTA